VRKGKGDRLARREEEEGKGWNEKGRRREGLRREEGRVTSHHPSLNGGSSGSRFSGFPVPCDHGLPI
jgi:hypothetical protein